MNSAYLPKMSKGDIRYATVFENVVVDVGILIDITIEIAPELPKYNSHISESVGLVNWMLRRLLTETEIEVLGYEHDSNYEELYDSFYSDFRFSLLAFVHSLLERKDFKPMTVQTMVTGRSAFMSFGAVDVKKLSKSDASST